MRGRDTRRPTLAIDSASAKEPPALPDIMALAKADRTLPSIHKAHGRYSTSI